MKVNYLGELVDLKNFKNSVNFEGVEYYPVFNIYKNGEKISLSYQNEKTTNLTYHQVLIYNDIIEGDIVYYGLSNIQL